MVGKKTKQKYPRDDRRLDSNIFNDLRTFRGQKKLKTKGLRNYERIPIL
jgi:hypothetical protein